MAPFRIWRQNTGKKCSSLNLSDQQIKKHKLEINCSWGSKTISKRSKRVSCFYKNISWMCFKLIRLIFASWKFGTRSNLDFFRTTVVRSKQITLENLPFAICKLAKGKQKGCVTRNKNVPTYGAKFETAPYSWLPGIFNGFLAKKVL